MIHQVQEALGQQLFGYINSMVILGAEPMIVDTGTPANRQQLSSGAPTAYRTGAGTEGR